MPRRIDFDHASTTAIAPEILKSYEELLKTYYANSDALYEEGTTVSKMMEKARGAIAGLLGVSSNEVFFTSGSSESNSWAIKGVCLAQTKRKRILTSSIEHPSVMNACAQMERLFGYQVTYLPVNEQGIVKMDALKAALNDDVALVSIMAVNNETGAIQPVEQIQDLVQKNSQAYFHCDVTQAVGKIELPYAKFDLFSVSAHKLEGLKGSGLLIKKKHIPIEPLISGGEQEQGVRGGTSNALVNCMMAKTLRLTLENSASRKERVQTLHDQLVNELSKIDGIEINSGKESVPGILNFSYEKIPSEVMQNALNEKGFMVSSRSTCASHSQDPSYVLTAMGFSSTRASSCIRVSLSSQNTKEEVTQFCESLKEIIQHYG